MVIKEFTRKGITRLRSKASEFLAEDKEKENNYYSNDELLAKAAHFNLQHAAVLIDGNTQVESLIDIKEIEITGYYSFDFNVIGTKVNDHIVRPMNDDIFPQSGGWIVSSKNEFTSYSLNEILLEKGCERQVVLQHFKSRKGTTYYSYIDFFSNESKTTVHIHNYFDHCYNLFFPLDLRYTLRDELGDKIKAGQIIIPPGGIKLISSTDFDVSSFRGYLEIEFEITSNVNPFLHYHAFYDSADFISGNHQSGLGLVPSGSLFTRGFIPVAAEDNVTIVLFQKQYDNPIKVNSILEYTLNGERIRLEKTLPDLLKGQMIFQNVKEFFPEVEFEKVQAPYLTLISDFPVYRPNFYYHKKGKTGFYDTTHAGPDPRYYGSKISKEESEKLNQQGCFETDIRSFIFPAEYEIDTHTGLWNNSDTDLSEFTFNFYSSKGELLHSFEDRFDVNMNTYLNINQFLKNKKIEPFHGTMSLHPTGKNGATPAILLGHTGYQHHRSNYMTSTANGSRFNNAPFYFRASSNRYSKCGVQISDFYAPGLYSDAFDTYFMIIYPTVVKEGGPEREYRLTLINDEGKRSISYGKIKPHGCKLIKLSELVEDCDLKSDNNSYAVWLFSLGAYLWFDWLTIRKTDCAITMEHCYMGKFSL